MASVLAAGASGHVGIGVVRCVTSVGVVTPPGRMPTVPTPNRDPAEPEQQAGHREQPEPEDEEQQARRVPLGGRGVEHDATGFGSTAHRAGTGQARA